MKNLFLLQFKIIRNIICRLSFFDEVKISVVLLFAVFFLTGIYLSSWRLLYYLNSVAVIGPLLINKLISLIFFVSFSMVVFSSLITSFNTIFSSRDLPWLMTKPISIRQIFSFKAFATSFYASWMVVLMFFPFILAFGHVKNVGLSFYILTFLLLVPFLIIASVIGIFFSLILMRFLPSHRTRDILLLLGILFITGLYIIVRFIQPERLVSPDGLDVVAQYLNYLNAPTAVYLPSWWLTGSIFSLISKNTNDLVFYFILLYTSAFAAIIIISSLSKRFYFLGWTESQIYLRRKKEKSKSYHSYNQFYALLKKDINVFFRDTNQWSQILVLGSLVVIYLFSIYKLPLETMYLQNLVSFFNLGLIGFIIAAVALRFIFPLISIEGENLWILRSAPLSIGKVLFEKTIFGGIPVLLLGMTLVFISNFLLKTDIQIFWISILAILIISIGIISLAIGFGSIFPRFNITNIAAIESSPGGVFFIITSLFYLVLNISFWSIPVHSFYRNKFAAQGFSYNYIWFVTALIIINAVTIILPVWLGLKSLKGIER